MKKVNVSKIVISSLAVIMIASAFLVTLPTQNVSAANSESTTRATTCWSQFYNRGIWFEIIMDKCAANQMISDWNMAWKILGPGFSKVAKYVPGFQAASLVKAVLQYGFKARMQYAISQSRGTISLSSLWINYPFPLVWAINW